MELQKTWDQAKRQSNYSKHGLDFVHAREVLQSNYCLSVLVQMKGEDRIISYAYAMNYLCVLTLFHTHRNDQIRIISFRKANQKEADFYFDWLANEWHEP